jgi:hypothetical protein
VKPFRWLKVACAGGVLLSLGSCASDLGYYVVDALIDYLPDLLAALDTTTTSS